MSGISTHVLDTASGMPARDIKVRLFLQDEQVGTGTTNDQGRIGSLLPDGVKLTSGVYRIVFSTSSYFKDGFYPEVSISFTVTSESAQYHVPLLISPFGYTTYRGS